MSYSDLPGRDASGPVVWQRESSNHLRHGEQPTRIGPRRHRRQERGFSPLQSFLRTATRVAGQTKGHLRPVREQHQRALQRVSVCTRKLRQPKAGSKRTWVRFGRYLERDEANPERAGFTPEQERGASISDQLRDWQRNGDERVISIILSPEHPMELKEFTRAWIERLEREQGVKLDWIAAVHNNTEHPHVHVVFRERSREGRPFQFSERDLRERFRQHAREVATEFLGYRAGKQPEHERTHTRERGFAREWGFSKER